MHRLFYRAYRPIKDRLRPLHRLIRMTWFQVHLIWIAGGYPIWRQGIRTVVDFIIHTNHMMNLIQQKREVMSFGQPSRASEADDHRFNCLFRSLLAMITHDLQRFRVESSIQMPCNIQIPLCEVQPVLYLSIHTEALPSEKPRSPQRGCSFWLQICCASQPGYPPVSALFCG